jgi:hypothetical protein
MMVVTAHDDKKLQHLPVHKHWCYCGGLCEKKKNLNLVVFVREKVGESCLHSEESSVEVVLLNAAPNKEKCTFEKAKCNKNRESSTAWCIVLS